MHVTYQLIRSVLAKLQMLVVMTTRAVIQLVLSPLATMLRARMATMCLGMTMLRARMATMCLGMTMLTVRQILMWTQLEVNPASMNMMTGAVTQLL